MKQANGNQEMTKRILNNGFLLSAILLMVMSFAFSGCSTKQIELHRHLYKPNIPQDIMTHYKGKQIDLNSFENQDEKTRKWSYSSVDQSIKYETKVQLEDFIMDCFRDAMWNSGMSVLKLSPAPKIPNMSLIIDRWTDETFKFTINIKVNDALKYRNQYTVTMPAVSSEDLQRKEKNAYEMINKAVVAVMGDPEIKAVFK